MPVGHTKIGSNKRVVLSHRPKKFRLSDQLLLLAKPCGVCPCFFSAPPSPLPPPKALALLFHPSAVCTTVPKAAALVDDGRAPHALLASPPQPMRPY